MKKGRKFGVFCNESGSTFCGSDGVFRLDARNTSEQQMQDMKERRGVFKKNFPHKFNQFTHCMLVDSLYDISKITLVYPLTSP